MKCLLYSNICKFSWSSKIIKHLSSLRSSFEHHFIEIFMWNLHYSKSDHRMAPEEKFSISTKYLSLNNLISQVDLRNWLLWFVACFCRFLTWLILRRWRWKRYVPTKRLTLSELHSGRAQNNILMRSHEHKFYLALL
jgi:hypothetical protein